jgi:hypothetical protein
MRSWAVEISSSRMYRDLFWLLANIAPFALCGMLALLAVPKHRRAAAVGLLFCASVAALAATTFHYNYALLIWRGHDSAIRWLDTSALLAGFAAGAPVYALGLIVRATVRRMAR